MQKSKKSINNKTALREVVINNNIIIWYVSIIKNAIKSKNNISFLVFKNKHEMKFIIISPIT